MPKTQEISGIQKCKGISSVMGALILHIVCGTLYVWSNINTYYISYLKRHGSPNIILTDGYFLMPLAAFVNTFSSWIGPILDSYIHIKACVFVSILIISIANFIIYYSTQIKMIYLAMVLMGVASGISLNQITKNSWYYFPNNRGFVSGFILFGYGFSGFIFTSIADMMINPTYVKIDPVTKMFNETIANNTFNFIKVFVIILEILCVIAFLCIFEYKEEKKSKTEETEQLAKNDEEDNIANPIIQVFTSRQIWQMITMNFCMLVFCFTCSNTYRTFGQLNQIDEQLLSILSKLFSIINGTGRLFWGILFDKFSFKCLYSVIVLAEIGISATLYYAAQVPYLYCVLVSCQSLILAGNVSLLVPLYPKIFGIKYTTLIFALAGVIASTNSLVSPTLSKIILNGEKDYRTLFWVGTGCATVSLIMLIIFKEEKFRYKKEEKGKELIEKPTEKEDA